MVVICAGKFLTQKQPIRGTTRISVDYVIRLELFGSNHRRVSLARKDTAPKKKIGGHDTLKGPSQPPPFSMPSKLLILHGATKSYCFTISCFPGSMFDYL